MTFQERSDRLPEILSDILTDACTVCKENGFSINEPTYTLRRPDEFGNTTLLFNKNFAETHSAVAVRFFLKKLVNMLTNASRYLGIHTIRYEECNPAFDSPLLSFTFTDKTKFPDCDTIKE